MLSYVIFTPKILHQFPAEETEALAFGPNKMFRSSNCLLRLVIENVCIRLVKPASLYFQFVCFCVFVCMYVCVCVGRG